MKNFKLFIKENANQERVREKIKAEKEADKEKHDRMMDRARTRDTRVANAKEEVELDEAANKEKKLAQLKKKEESLKDRLSIAKEKRAMQARKGKGTGRLQSSTEVKLNSQLNDIRAQIHALDEASLRKSIATNSGKFPEGSNVKHSKSGKVGKVLTVGKDFVKVAHGNRQKDYHPSELNKIHEAKYSVDVEGLPRFYMDADSPAQVKIALRKLLRKASSIDSVERVNDAKIKQDLRQRLKGAETDNRYVDEAKKGLWYNIHQKRKRGEKPNPPGHPDRPTAQDFKDAAKTSKK